MKKSLAETQRELEFAQSKVKELETKLAEITQEREAQTQASQGLIQRLEALRSLDQAMLSAASLENLAQLALDHIIQFIPCVRVTISTIDLDTNTMSIIALHDASERVAVPQKIYPIDDAYLASIRHDPWLIIHELNQSGNVILAELYEQGIRSILLIPLRAEGKLVGLLNFHSVEEAYFTEAILQIAQEVGNQLAVGIHKALMSDSLARYAQRMEILHAINLGLIQGGSVKLLIERTFKQLLQLIPCDRIGIGVIDNASQEVLIYTSQFNNESELKEGIRIPIPPKWFDDFASNGTRLFQNLHLSDDPTLKRLVQEGYQSQLQVLLQADSVNIGVMGFSSAQLNFFTEEYQEIAVEVSSRLTIALHQLLLAQALERYTSELEQRVTERTAELQTSKDQIEAILHNSLEGILLIDRDLRILQANPAVSRLLSVELDNQKDVSLADFVHDDDAQRLKETVEQAVAEEATQPLEVRAKHPNGDVFELELNIGYIPGDGLVSTLHNITAQKQTELALKQALEKERELVKAKTHFLSVASHEFRTPLSAILMASDTLLSYRDRLDSSQINQRLERIQQNVKHMIAIIEDTLQLSRIESGRLEFKPLEADFDLLCRNLLDDFEEATTAQKRLIYKSNASPMILKFDLRLMKQVMSNLISNALKYSPADKNVFITLIQEPSRILFSVKDFGIGIPQEDLENLFEPFHRASNTGSISGTGLGLNITKQIIELHHGQITVESQIGQGTTFDVMLPILNA